MMFHTRLTDARGPGSVLAAVLLSAVCAAAVSAQGEALTGSTPKSPVLTEAPAAEVLFERHIEAIGGRENLDKLENRRITGTYKGAPFEYGGKMQIWWERDGRFHQYIGEPGGMRYHLYVNGTRTWASVLGKDPVPIGGTQRIELLDTTDFLGEANYKNRYKSYETAGAGMADGRAVWVVKAVTTLGRPHTLFFDQETGLVLGTKTPTTGAEGIMREMMVRLEDYKEFGGVLYPTRILQKFTNGEDTNEYRYNEVVVNSDEAHDYTVPESIEKLFAEMDERAEAAEGEPDASPAADDDTGEGG